MELRVVLVINSKRDGHQVSRYQSKKYYSIISEQDGPMVAIFSGKIRVQDILFGLPNNDCIRLRVTKDLLEQIKNSTIISESTLFPHDRQFFLQKNDDGTLSDLRDGHVLDL